MLKALNPVIAKSEGSGNRALMLRASMTGNKFAYIILAVFAIPFIIETPYILKIWLKSTPEWTIVFCRLQLLRSLIEQLTITLGSSIAAQGEIKGLFTGKKHIRVTADYTFCPIISFSLSTLLYVYSLDTLQWHHRRSFFYLFFP